MSKDKDDDVKRLWQRICRERGQLAPLMGSYVASSAESPRTIPTVVADWHRRHKKQKKVSSRKYKETVPDVAYLRSKGICLPRESEILDSQRLLPKSEDKMRPDYLHVLTLLTRERDFSQMRFKHYSSQSLEQRYRKSLEPHKTSQELTRMRSTIVQHIELLNQISARREMESRITHLMLCRFNMNLKTSLANARPSEQKTRKFIHQALDEDNRRLASEARLARCSGLDRDSRIKMFDEWKKSMEQFIDQQCNTDMDLARSVRKFNKSREASRVRKKHQEIDATNYKSRKETKHGSMNWM